MLSRLEELYCWRLLNQVEMGDVVPVHQLPDILFLGLLIDEEPVRGLLGQRLGSPSFSLSYLSGFHSSDAIEVLGRERIVPRAVIVVTDDGLVERFKLRVAPENTDQIARTLALKLVKALCESSRVSEALINGQLALSYCHIRGIYPLQPTPTADFMTTEVMEIAASTCGKKSPWFHFRINEYLCETGSPIRNEALLSQS